MIKVISVALGTMMLSIPSFAAQITYASCDLPATEAKPAWHNDYTLDEQRGIVSNFAEQANVTNEVKALFGPDAVTWSLKLSVLRITWKISRIDLTFVEDTEYVGSPVEHRVGKCTLVDSSSRKF